MKRKFLNIVLFIGLLFSSLLSCSDNNDVHTLHTGSPMLTFEFYPALPPLPAVVTPPRFLGTVASIQNFNVGVPPAGREITVRVVLRPARGDNGTIPFNIRVMPHIEASPNAHTTLASNAIVFPTSGTIAAGESSATFTFTVNYEYLAPGAASGNRIFLQVIPADDSSVANSQMSRVSFQFTKQTPPPIIPVTGVTLNRDALLFVYGQSQTQTLTATVAPANATNRAVEWESSDEDVATVDDYGVVTAVGVGTATITVTTDDGDFTASATVTVSALSTALDGVVINGITWATRNVDALGAFADYPQDVGMFFQWNRSTAWAATGAVTDWDSSVPAGTGWESANNPCPTGWRVPTQQELQSLNSAGSIWITFNEVNGRVFGTAPNQIFLPAAGARSAAGALGNVGVSGHYWSSTPFATTTATSLLFDSAGSSSDMSTGNRAQGFSVRCVAE